MKVELNPTKNRLLGGLKGGDWEDYSFVGCLSHLAKWGGGVWTLFWCVLLSVLSRTPPPWKGRLATRVDAVKHSSGTISGLQRLLRLNIYVILLVILTVTTGTPDGTRCTAQRQHALYMM